MDLDDDGYWFGCSPVNPLGLKLRFEVDAPARAARAPFTPAPEHQGYRGFTHGGILAAVLDEAMLKLCWELGIPAVTARLEVELKKPAPTGAPYVVRGWLEEDRGRVLRLRAELTNANGETVATARATAAVTGTRRPTAA
jgi:acyl-coenzyme A thioesterase PaaI-like protein